MKDTITKYIATITMGDEYHKEGEEHIVSENLVERTQQGGLELEVGENKFLNITYYHYYPCTLKKVVYRLDPIEITPFPGYDNKYVGYGSYDYSDPNDWQDHWP